MTHNKHANLFKKHINVVVIIVIIGFFVYQVAFIQHQRAQGSERILASMKALENQTSGPDDLHAQAAVLMDGDSGRVLFAKNHEEALPNASTTKLLTCILALENSNLDDIVTASQYAASMPQVAIGVKENEQYYLRDILYSLMLESHNDSAVMIAEHISGSVEAFAELMNEKAKSIGCENTFFVTPNGLDAEALDKNGNMRQHSTSARDLALILRYCLMISEEKEMFAEITKTPYYNFSSLNTNRNISCYNHNAFLKMMNGAGPGKTGFTGKAGYCYAGSLENDGRTYIVALLACGWPDHKTYKWQDTKKLMNYGIDNYHYREIDEPLVFSPVPVKGGINPYGSLKKEGFVTIGIAENTNQSMRILLKDDETVEVKTYYESELLAPVKCGVKIGEVNYVLNDQVIRQQDIITLSESNKVDMRWSIERMMEAYLSECN